MKQELEDAIRKMTEEIRAEESALFRKKRELQDLRNYTLDGWNSIEDRQQCYPGKPLPELILYVKSLRGIIGDTFIRWADKYFSLGKMRDKRIPRKDMYEHYLSSTRGNRLYCSPILFKQRIIKYCEFRGFEFNPHRPDADRDDKSGGVEYFTVRRR